MPVIDINLEGDNAWPELLGQDIIHLPHDTWKIAVLPAGMASGKPSIALRIDLPDGQTVVVETSMAAWVAATVAMHARYPEVFAGTPLD